MLLLYSFWFYFSALTLLYIGEVVYHHTNERICCSRWWERHVAPLMVSGTRMVVDRSSRHHRHPTSRISGRPNRVTPPTHPWTATTAAAWWAQCSSTSIYWLHGILCNPAPSVQQDRRAAGCRCLDSQKSKTR